MTAGIVCEYNPFHKGHLYHIEETKKHGAESIVCVMSGNFVQRGECAFLDKWTRAKIAVRSGADIVIDLPVPWAMASGETFARGSIGLLAAFGIDLLSFGSEFTDKAALSSAAKAADDEEVGSLLRSYLSNGINYPLSLSKAAGKKFGKEVQSILSSPNSTLATEYIRQLQNQSHDIDFLPVKRMGALHDSQKENGGLLSASAIRKALSDGCDVSAFLPDFAANDIEESFKKGHAPCLMKNGERAVLSSLRQTDKDELKKYITNTNGLTSRIYEASKTAASLEELYEKAKSKNFTHAAIRREILNAYLKIDKTLCEGIPPYIKILAASENGIKLLKKAKAFSTLPIITRHSETQTLDEKGKAVYILQCHSTDKFCLFSKNIRVCGLEQKNSMIKI